MSAPSSNTTTPLYPPSQTIPKSPINSIAKSHTGSASSNQRKSHQNSSRKEGTKSGPEDFTDVDDKHQKSRSSKRNSLPPSSARTSGSNHRSSHTRSKESLSKFPVDFSLLAQVRATKQAQPKHKNYRRSTSSLSRKSVGHDHSDKSISLELETPLPPASEKAQRIDQPSLSVPTGWTNASTISNESNSTLTQNSYDTHMDEAKAESLDSLPSPLSYSALPVDEGVPMTDPPNMRSAESNEISSGKEVVYPMTPSPHSMSSPYSYGSSDVPETASTRSTVPSPTSPWSNQRSDECKAFGIPSYDAGQAQTFQNRSGGPAFHPSDLQRMRPEGPAWYAHPSQDRNASVGGYRQAHHDYMASFEQVPPRVATSEHFDSSKAVPATWWRQPQPHQEHFQRQRPSSAGVPPDSGETSLKESRPPPQNSSRPGPAPPAPPAPEPPDLSGMTLEGYELLATRLADNTLSVRPIYRKFEKLNHRILLWLQDEICGYEDQLRVLDEWIAQTERARNEGKSKPASRRAEEYSNSELYYQRKFVLGEIFVKMELYYRVLGSYREVSKDVHLPKPGEVTAYREWMMANRPVDEHEAAFLKHDQDLIVLPRRHYETSSVRAAAGGVTLMLLLPVIAFAVIPNLLGRVFMVAVIAIAQWMMVSAMEIRHILTVREWIVCTGIYVMIMAMMAAVPR